MVQARPFSGLLLAFLISAGGPVIAQERTTLGWGRLLTNDAFGDTQDRWRSGAYGISMIRGFDWQGSLPTRVGQVMEYRFRGETITPSNMANPPADARLYAGVLSLGAHSHFAVGPLDLSLGADLMSMGEQSGVREFQTRVHRFFGLDENNVEDHQVDNGFYFHGTAEVGHEFSLGGARLRPFMEFQAGVETLARAGVDLTFGGYGLGGLRVRDSTTGQRISAIDSVSNSGLSFLIGGDIAYVDSSVLLPANRGYQVEELRSRLRGGINYAFGESSNIFYGLTYLSEEFVGQPEGQVVGSLSIGLQF